MSFLGAFRISRLPLAARTFSTSRPSLVGVARLTLVGRLGRDPEVRMTKADKEYVTYIVGTTNSFSSPPGPDGVRPPPSTSWHRVVSFSPSVNSYLRTLEKGTLVYVEANYEIKEPNREAEAGSPESQRQVFLRHDSIRVLRKPVAPETRE
ncbi:hypothetical protein BS47DRAFT_1381642 [Hydnum rufescens UP504]|uniref:Nucleic acid-binding protein n=1 Tax=Hydnum rufescens UP504 TaxID=1448309 RepID=A0A9P6DYN4_9AGAM|nr:hypothetical protein BS47DRAFT_1381642 [Hydnum rufescens UP504]